MFRINAIIVESSTLNKDLLSTFGMERNNGILKVIEIEEGGVAKFHASLWELVSKDFLNYPLVRSYPVRLELFLYS